jgi:hypothetical protein
MRLWVLFLRLVFVMPAVSIALASYGYASTVTFRAELKGANVVPPNESSARGYLNASYDTVSRRLTWTGTQSALSSKITGIHFHAPASPNKTAGIVETIESLSEGSTTLSEAHAADLIGGYWYVDIHTRAHPQGEIRGQMMRGE